MSLVNLQIYETRDFTSIRATSSAEDRISRGWPAVSKTRLTVRCVSPGLARVSETC